MKTIAGIEQSRTFLLLPRMRTRAASRSPRVRRMGRIPMQRTMVPWGPAQRHRPAPWCPVGSHPTGLGLLAPPPLRPPASSNGEPIAQGLQFPHPPVGGPLSSNPEGPIRGGAAGPHIPWWLATGQESLPQPRRAWGDERAANPPVFLGRHKGTQRHRCRNLTVTTCQNCGIRLATKQLCFLASVTWQTSA